MARTQLRGTQVADGSIQRDDLDVTTAGEAVVRKILVAGGLSLTSTGVDSGTGDVTLAPASASIVASEALVAGNWVTVWSNGGTANVRKANATGPIASALPVHGYVLAAFSASASAVVYFAGINTQVSGMTPGDVYLQTTAGAGGAAAPTGTTGSGTLIQIIGVAISATAVAFQPGGMRLYL